MEKLALEIQESKSFDVGNNQMITFVCVTDLWCGQYSTLYQKIFGDYKLIAEDALVSAILATLFYLQKIECQRKLLDASRK